MSALIFTLSHPFNEQNAKLSFMFWAFSIRNSSLEENKKTYWVWKRKSYILDKPFIQCRRYKATLSINKIIYIYPFSIVFLIKTSGGHFRVNYPMIIVFLLIFTQNTKIQNMYTILQEPRDSSSTRPKWGLSNWFISSTVPSPTCPPRVKRWCHNFQVPKRICNVWLRHWCFRVPK